MLMVIWWRLLPLKREVTEGGLGGKEKQPGSGDGRGKQGVGLDDSVAINQPFSYNGNSGLSL